MEINAKFVELKPVALAISANSLELRFVLNAKNHDSFS